MDFFGSGYRLVKSQIDLIGFVNFPISYFGHSRTKRLEIIYHGLIDQNIAVNEKKDSLFNARFPEPPDDLKSGIGFAGAGGHHK